MKPSKGASPFDAWSWVHVASGLALGILRVPRVLATAAIIGFEGLEAGLRRIRKEEGGLFEHESGINIAADIAIGMAGYEFGRALTSRATRTSLALPALPE